MSSRGWRSASLPSAKSKGGTSQSRITLRKIASAKLAAHLFEDVCRYLCDFRPSGRSLAVCAARDDTQKKAATKFDATTRILPCHVEINAGSRGQNLARAGMATDPLIPSLRFRR